MEEYKEEFKEIEKDEECCKQEALSPSGLIGAAILGAVGSMVLYYIFCNLSDETKQIIRENVASIVKKQLAGLK